MLNNINFLYCNVASQYQIPLPTAIFQNDKVTGIPTRY